MVCRNIVPCLSNHADFVFQYISTSSTHWKGTFNSIATNFNSFTMDTVASSSPSSGGFVELIKIIYSKIQTIKEPNRQEPNRQEPNRQEPNRQEPNRPKPIEITHEWPYTSDGSMLPSHDWAPDLEHCIRLCGSLKYRFGRENRL